MTGSFLDVAGLDVFYGSSQILFGVGFTVERGQTTALLGRNGAGKSTTFKALAGLAPPRRGSVTLAQAYWDRFESIEEADELELDEAMNNESGQATAQGRDIGAKDVKVVGNVPKLAMSLPAQAENAQTAFNDEIEDIDSDDEFALAQHQLQQ